MNLRQRLEALVANERLQRSTDKNFAESLKAYYDRTGKLTAGRKKWLLTLEVRYAADAPDKSNTALGTRIAVCLDRVEPSSWDQGFLESVQVRNQQQGSLSPRQMEILEKIEERTSDAAIARRKTWHESYGEDEREKMRVIAAYYMANPPYYRDLATRVLEDSDFVPTEKQFRSMTTNKYALKILAETGSEAKYTVGQQVMGRASAPFQIRGKRGFIMKVGHEPVTSAARGGKKYLILPIGSPVPVTVEERYIKKAPKAK